MKFFRIAKWEKYQHYHKPRPPWLKIYTSINDLDTDWRPLKDAQLGQLVRMKAYAALNDNAMPFDGELMQELLGCDQPIDLAEFALLKVITVFPDRSSCLSKEKSRKKSRQNTIAPSSEVRDQSSDDRDQRTEKKKNAPREFPKSTEADGIQIQELTRQFIELRQSNDPGATIPGIVIPWEAEMGRIHFTDKRSYSQIREVMQYSQTDEFWMGNILTPRYLRQKFQQLVLNMKRGSGKKPRGFDGPDNRAERNREVMERTIKELDDAGDNQGIDGSGGDLQHTLEPGQDGRVSGDPERLPG